LSLFPPFPKTHVLGRVGLLHPDAVKGKADVRHVDCAGEG